MNKKYRIIALVITVVLLISLCGCTGKIDFSKFIPSKDKQTSVTTPTETMPAATVPATTAPLDRSTLSNFPYTVENKDHSYYDNATNKPVVICYYELVQLTGNSEAINKINDALYADYLNFKSGSDHSDMANYMRGPNGELPTFYHSYDAEVTHNANGIFCVKMSLTWFMGGVANSGDTCFTFDLVTGDIASICDATGKDFNDLKPQLDALLKNRINPSYYSQLAEMTSPEDYPFYIEKNEIILSFPEYVLGSGAETPIILHTGIFVN